MYPASAELLTGPRQDVALPAIACWHPQAITAGRNGGTIGPPQAMSSPAGKTEPLPALRPACFATDETDERRLSTLITLGCRLGVLRRLRRSNSDNARDSDAGGVIR